MGVLDVSGAGPTVGVSIKGYPPFSGSISSVDLDDGYSVADPSVLNGWFSIWGASFSPGIGYGCSMMQVGGSGHRVGHGAYGMSCGWSYGFDIGASTTAGSSTVIDSAIWDCGCTQ